MTRDQMIRIFIGYDKDEIVAYHVLSHSIIKHASQPVSIIPLKRELLPMYTRGRTEDESTDFSLSRFLVPHLCEYRGWAIFMDCDMLVKNDITKLFEYQDDRFDVQVVKHDHQPKETTKFLGQKQTAYEKKNWSSVMLFNCATCELTPRYVKEAPALDLHQFKWTKEYRIGEIPLGWNYLVGVSPHIPFSNISNFHWTLGGPWFDETEDAPFWLEWSSAYHEMNSPT